MTRMTCSTYVFSLAVALGACSDADRSGGSLGNLDTATTADSAGGGDGTAGGGTGGESTGGQATGGEGGTGTAGGDSGGMPGTDVLFDVGNEGESGAPPTCDPVDFDVTPPRPQVGLVLDGSGSMQVSTTYEGAQVSRWAALYGAVETLVGDTADVVDYGVLYFPQDGNCGVDQINLAVGAHDAATIMSVVPAPDALPGGGTPTEAAIDLMANHLLGAADERPQAMVLVTDGLPTCGNGASGVEQRIAAALADGISTYVMGFAFDPNNANAKQDLDAWAKAGGTSSGGTYDFFDVSDGDAVAAAFEQIVHDAIPCTLELPEPATDPDFVEVRVGGTKWPEVDDCNGLPGWTWSKPFEEITLCGSACEQLKTSQTAQVTFACPEG
ncbi:MAG: VWA domain-containing protein [Deltaproteobacteria bacterium]|nr:MAG: VWA domain-containing protein [Deltaproteobacteria bacterium]